MDKLDDKDSVDADVVMDDKSSDVRGHDVTGHDAIITTEDQKKTEVAAGGEAVTDANMLGLISGMRIGGDKESNVATVSQIDDVYDMTHKYRGYALVMNNERFGRRLKQMGLGDRAGTNIDEANIRRQLHDLGFKVRSISDRSAQQMLDACKDMASKNHSHCDCFVCVVLSHGDEGVVYGTDKTIEIKELVRPFKGDMCPSLIGKPKLFIIQACRGYQTDPGINVNVIDAKGKAPSDTEVKQEPNVMKLPLEADFLFAYSTIPGYYSWRNGINGSWFIQALCKILNEHGKEWEVRKILTVVNRKVAQDFQSNNPDNADFHMMKQIPCITTMLTKDLYFNTIKEKRLL